MVLAALAFVGEMFITDIFFLMMDPLAKPIYIGNDEQGMWSIIQFFLVVAPAFFPSAMLIYDYENDQGNGDIFDPTQVINSFTL